MNGFVDLEINLRIHRLEDNFLHMLQSLSLFLSLYTTTELRMCTRTRPNYTFNLKMQQRLYVRSSNIPKNPCQCLVPDSKAYLLKANVQQLCDSLVVCLTLALGTRAIWSSATVLLLGGMASGPCQQALSPPSSSVRQKCIFRPSIMPSFVVKEVSNNRRLKFQSENRLQRSAYRQLEEEWKKGKVGNNFNDWQVFALR